MLSSRRILNRFVKGRSSERGGVVVEFALAAPFFLIFVMGLIDFGRLFWIKSTMQFAVEETARYAMVTPSATTTELTTYAGNKTAATVSGITYTATETTVGTVDYRTIEASYTFSFLIPLIPMGDIVLGARSSTPINEP